MMTGYSHGLAVLFAERLSRLPGETADDVDRGRQGVHKSGKSLEIALTPDTLSATLPN
jgi:hypothetical protein